MTVRYVKSSRHVGPLTVRYIPIKDGDVVELGDTAPHSFSLYAAHSRHILLGFKPGTGPKASGWIVVLVQDDAPEASKPVRRRTRKAVAS